MGERIKYCVKIKAGICQSGVPGRAPTSRFHLKLPTTPSTTLWSDVRRACSQPPDEEEDAANSSRVVISALPTVQAAAPASLPLIVPRMPKKKSTKPQFTLGPSFLPLGSPSVRKLPASVMGPRGFFRHHVPHPSATLAAKKSLAAGAARRVLRVKVAEVGGLGRLLDFSPRDEDLRQVSLVFIYFRRGGGDEDGMKGEKEKLGEITEQSRQTTVTELNGKHRNAYAWMSKDLSELNEDFCLLKSRNLRLRRVGGSDV
ncbi:hypothetical protein C0Q70_01106 [Pomacea canaliculata]|uniref:Uncharacterized protein n=1 Tax=Pomacea canaliculata TaxID=400727 RepID=A0A2T7PYJ3_POMCA|nr:hypothetical protein C0Q70_01106 [Pomacea canaliculata]